MLAEGMLGGERAVRERCVGRADVSVRRERVRRVVQCMVGEKGGVGGQRLRGLKVFEER